MHIIPNADAEAGDLVCVVQRGTGDGGAADEDWRERGYRRYLACTPDLEENVFELGDSGAGGKLVGNGPAGRFAGEAEAALLRGGVYLDDNAVDLITKRVAQSFRLRYEGEHFINGIDGSCVRVDAEPSDPQSL